MNKHSIARMLGVVAVTVGTTTVPVTSARADVMVSNASQSINYSTYAHNSSGCTVANTGGTADGPLPLDGTPRTLVLSGSSSVTDGQGPQTLVTAAGSATGTASVRNGQLAAFDLAATGSLKLKADAGQTCGTTTYAYLQQSVDFTLTRPQWVAVSVSGTKQTDVWLDVSEVDDGWQVGTYAEDAGGTSQLLYYLPAGNFDLDAGVGWNTQSPGGPADLSQSGSGTLKVRLHDVGSAVAAASGIGRRYVTLGDQVSCVSKTLPVRFTSRAGRVRSATFTVNGKITKTVRSPKAGQTVAVPAPSQLDTQLVKVRLVVDPPGAVQKATVTVSRSYRPCDRR